MLHLVHVATSIGAKIQRPQLHYYEIDPEQNHFYTVGIDITHKCNMECANCYSPVRTPPDVPAEDIINFVKRLPHRTEVRLTGGEPTLRKDLAYLIKQIKSLGHRPVLMTNGLLLAQIDRVKELKDAGLKFVALSLNGADEDDIYEKLDNRRCASLKLKAFRNLVSERFFLNVHCILVRGVNEHIPEKLLALMDEHRAQGVIRVRNIGQLGRFLSADNFSLSEMVDLVAKPLGKDPKEIMSYNKVNGYEETHNVLFPATRGKHSKSYWLKITDWSPTGENVPDPNSRRRGRMTPNFKIAPAFEHVVINGY